MIWTLYLPGWIPAPLNQLLGNHHKAARLKAHDREIIGRACVAYGVKAAIGGCAGRRRVSMLVVWPPGKRAVDPDALFKSTLDALVHAGALWDDSANYVKFDQPLYARGEQAATYITIEAS